MSAVSVRQSGFTSNAHKKSLSTRRAEEAWEIPFAQWQVRPRRLPLQSCANTATQQSAPHRSRGAPGETTKGQAIDQPQRLER
jgi:hypothetical protein